MKIFAFVILLLSFNSFAGLGFYCKNALSLALKGYSYHKDYESSLKNVETRLYKIRMLTTKMLNQKKPSAKDKKTVLKNFSFLNSHFKKHKKTIISISSTTSCGEDLVKDMSRLQPILKKPMKHAEIQSLNKISTKIISTLNSIK